MTLLDVFGDLGFELLCFALFIWALLLRASFAHEFPSMLLLLDIDNNNSNLANTDHKLAQF